MLDKFFQKSLSFDDAKKVALAEGLIDVNGLNANDYNIVLDVVRNNKKFTIPEKFLKVIPTNTLFDYADKKEVAKELIARSNKMDFELPHMSGY
ncbi:MAG TPA: hypothetical protein DHV62_07070 [Elusimicrobia bacterium]|nr:hypothetical protein [Elusimicrobiota bacterium]